MKSSKAETHAKFHKIPRLQFSPERQFTSYAGLVIIQALAKTLMLKARFRQCFAHLRRYTVYGPASIVMLVVLLVMLGFRRLRDLDYCHDDPLLARVAGLRTLPNVSTVSRTLAGLDEEGLDNFRAMIRDLVLERLQAISPARITLDFDGSVVSTRGHAEGTAIGYNPRNKGARSYYPLFATIAQTEQFFDVLHRPGNVHDSNGAADFMSRCFWELCSCLPGIQLETRLDSAFFNELVFLVLQEYAVEFSCSVPFERFPALKQLIEKRERWQFLSDGYACFELDWKPKSWDDTYRLICVRKAKAIPSKEPIQLDLFIPKAHEFEYSVIATNKTSAAKKVVAFHHGRGSQEKLIGEGKQHAALDVVAGRRLSTNRAFALAAMLAHNLSRELQMAAQPPRRRSTPKRSSLFQFLSLGTLRQRLFHRAGKLSRPAGELTLTINANDAIEAEIHRYLGALSPAC